MPKTSVNKTYNFSDNNIGSGTIQERNETHNLSEVKQFYLNPLTFVGYRNRYIDQTKSLIVLIFAGYATMFLPLVLVP